MPNGAEQRNPFKGSPPRPWVRVLLVARDGGNYEVQLLADTGNPCAIIISQALMASLKLRAAPDLTTNFGLLQAGWLRVIVPELRLDEKMVGYASDTVVAAAMSSSTDFEGLAGLPFLRLVESWRKRGPLLVARRARAAVTSGP